MKVISLYIIVFTAALFACFNVKGQTLSGTVTEKDEHGKELPLPGANVYWLGSTQGTSTDSGGKFSLAAPSLPANLVFSFVGYQNDTLLVSEIKEMKIILKKSVTLNEVDVTGRQQSLSFSTTNTINIEKIGTKELLKAACCNLSESFETSPTVNVSYTDALTGAKEIRLLGLAGVYSQLLLENIPSFRGLASSYGLTFVPGPWIESIQVTKGSGSVLSGFESTSGQINVELKKPETAEKFYINLYGAGTTNAELNFYHTKKTGKHWNEITLLHCDLMQRKWDDNHDGFMDLPLTRQINLSNRWRYHSGNKLESQIGIQLLFDERNGGQLSFNPSTDKLTTNAYGTGVNTARFSAYVKTGFLYPEKPDKSIGTILSFTTHRQNAFFGLKNYDATQNSFFGSLIYQNNIGSKVHNLKLGGSAQADLLNENFINTSSDTSEIVPGVFAEYTFTKNKFASVAGLRTDYHNNYGWFLVPRLHLKYNFTDALILRASGGRSFRRAHPLADNISLLANSRQIIFTESIAPEIAWNYGANFTAIFTVLQREATFNLDYYRTWFINQLVADSYSDSLNILFYNLSGESFSNALQAALSIELAETLKLRLAYKNDDVRSTYNGKLHEKPLTTKHKALINLAWEPNIRWKLDGTLLWEGKKNLAYSSEAGNESSSLQQSPSFITLNAQVTRNIKKWEVYAGVENITGFTQHNPIVSAESPFSSSFDATNIWGPVMGRKIYVGVRFAFY